jgi:hypothetical protein
VDYDFTYLSFTLAITYETFAFALEQKPSIILLDNTQTMAYPRWLFSSAKVHAKRQLKFKIVKLNLSDHLAVIFFGFVGSV